LTKGIKGLIIHTYTLKKSGYMLKPGLHKPGPALKALQREMLCKNGLKLLTPKEVAKEIKAHDQLTKR
jgi:hypothetical protein